MFSASGFKAASRLRRSGGKGSESWKAALTTPLPFLTCAAFAVLAQRTGNNSLRGSVKLAPAIWVIAPLPLILTNAAFLKLHRVFVGGYLLAWLVKLLIAAVAVGVFLR